MKAQWEKEHLEKVKSLSFWTTSVEVSAISGGLNNSNYLVNHKGDRYVVRIEEEEAHLGINRYNELLCAKVGYRCDVSPSLVYSKPGVIVTEFIEARVLGVEEGRKRKFIEKMAEVLRTLHNVDHRHTEGIVNYSPFEQIKNYARKARQLGAGMPAGIDEMLEDLTQLERMMGQFVPTFCHNDPYPTNWLIDGANMWIIDWEHAGIGNPMYDLGYLSVTFGFTTELDEQLIRCYQGEVTDKVMRDLKVMKTVALLRGVLWGLIRSVTSEVNFDFRKHAADRFEAYHALRKELGTP